uniref:Ig-like domain-containing protein n=1 Tax=Seriola lalandi dorsalis TaxID=1841481 RepID=A0A3B4YN31_SERLL
PHCVFFMSTVSSRVTVTLQPNSSLIYSGEKITVRCEIQGGGDTLWTYEWRTPSSNNPPSHSEYTISKAALSHSGDYSCRGSRDYYLTEWSRVMRLTVSCKVTVTLQPNWSVIYSGEKITVRCEIQGGGDTEWTYEWSTPSSNNPPSHSEYTISKAALSHSGDYSCRGRRDYYLTEWSRVMRLTVSYKPRPVLTVSPSWLSPGASVTLKCEVELPSAGWRFYWYKATHTAGYVCKAGRGDPVIYTETSELNRPCSSPAPVVSLQTPNWSTFFTGESVTLICDTQEREETDWEYQIKKDNWEFVQYNSYKRYTLHLWTGYSSEYQCFARHRRTYEIKHSNIMSLIVSDSWFPVPLIVGLVCGLLLIVLLLLLFRYRKTKSEIFPF